MNIKEIELHNENIFLNRKIVELQSLNGQNIDENFRLKIKEKELNRREKYINKGLDKILDKIVLIKMKSKNKYYTMDNIVEEVQSLREELELYHLAGR